MSKLKLATVWLDGCSGCHMSFLDMDERLLELFNQAELVYSPLVDIKEFPEQVDITLVEGAVSNEDDLEKLKKVRAHTNILVALGDCAVTGNVPAMRNSFGTAEVLKRSFVDNATLRQQPPSEVIPRLLAFSKPIHELVQVDVFVPGCPPPSETIYHALEELLAGHVPDFAMTARFGA